VADSNDITSFSLCQALFSSFFKLFQRFHSQIQLSFITVALASDLIRIPHASAFVNTFFSSFSNFFRRCSGRYAVVPRRRTPVPQALAYIIRGFSPCQHLFSSFLSFFCTTFSTTISAASVRFMTTIYTPPPDSPYDPNQRRHSKTQYQVARGDDLTAPPPGRTPFWEDPKRQ